MKKYVKLYEEFIEEGINDPNILKAFFMAGGPGSGKSYVASELFNIPKDTAQSVSYRTGLKTVNSDPAFELELKKMGVDPKTLGEMDPEEFDKLTKGEDSPRAKAKKITTAKQELYTKNLLGMIIDGTGDDFRKIADKKKALEAHGYDCFMVFVNTSLEVALARNAKRSRSLPEELVKESWHAVQNNLGKFQNLFGSTNMIIVDNTVDMAVDFEMIEKSIQKMLNKPIQNPIGKKILKK